MTEYLTAVRKVKILEQRRKVKQFIMGIIFLVILAGGWRYPLLGYFIPLCVLSCPEGALELGGTKR